MFSLQRCLRSLPSSLRTSNAARPASAFKRFFSDPKEKFPIESSLKQSTGRELAELEAEEAGRVLYSREPLRGPFGTKENPALVPSSKTARIVGCVGHAESEHPVMYFELTNGPMQRCVDCGQVFKLQQISIADDDGH